MADDLRHELKFVFPLADRPRLDAWLRLNPEGFREAYPERRVNSLYFDDPDLATVEDNLSGLSERSKLRYRWYGEHPLLAAGALELKGRRAGLGWKRLYPLAAAPPPGSFLELRRHLKASLPPDAQRWLNEYPQATLVTRYRRRYLLSADRRLRATVDERLEAFDQRFAHQLTWARPAPRHDLLVLELKCAAEDDRLAAEAIRGLPARRTRSSKYVFGLLDALS